MTDEIFGRDAELASVRAFLDDRTARLRAFVLEGAAGVGKSTVWLAGVAAARDRGFRVLVSRPSENEQGLPNLVLGDLFSDASQGTLAALPAPRRRALEAALLLRDGADAPADPRALGVAVATLLPMLAERAPLVIAIDDDQWMDASSSAALGFALPRSRDQPIRLFLTRRVEATSTSRLDLAAEPGGAISLRIGPLSVGAIQVLIRRRLGHTFPRPMLVRLHEASGGNPFYALELARAQTDDPTRDTTLPVAGPASLNRLVDARLDALDPPARRALLLLAANGRLPVEKLRSLAAAEADLHSALAAGLVERRDGAVSFTHPLLAAAVYRGATDDERQAAHRELAAASSDPVHRSRHLALGVDGPDHDIARSLESAAGIARLRGMPIAAAELAEHALRHTPSDAVEDRHRRSISAARAHLGAGAGDRAQRIAMDLSTTAPAGRLRAQALVLRSEFEPAAVTVASLREALTEAAGVPELEAMIHAALIWPVRVLEGGAAAVRQAREAVRMADAVDDDALRAEAMSLLAFLHFDQGEPDALELADQAHRLAATVADLELLKGTGSTVDHVLAWSGPSDRSRTWLERRLEEWGDRDEQIRSEILWYLALVELWAGRWTIASEWSDEARAIDLQYGLERPADLLPAALIALHRGRLAEAREHSRRALSMAEGQLLDTHIAVLATCDLWSGQPALAIDQFERAERAADAKGLLEPTLRHWRAEYAEALLQVGQVDEAARLIAEWEAAAARLGRERVLAQAMRCRGLVSAARGDLSTAASLLEAAANAHEAIGDPFGRARSLLALGATRRRARQKRAARSALEAALAGFDVLGATSWTAAVQAELARIGGRQRIEGLSPSEVSVATLVAEGRTNREIAAALFLGERTVTSHLTHIYSKLGIRSRTELARHASFTPHAEGGGKVPTS